MHVPGAGHESATSVPLGACTAWTGETVQAGAGAAAARTRNAALTRPQIFNTAAPRDHEYKAMTTSPSPSALLTVAVTRR